MMTLSPPCPSWSKGGKHSGLATDEGFCFLDAVEHMSRVRPIIALLECSDGIEAHPHWRVLSAAMQLAGISKHGHRTLLSINLQVTIVHAGLLSGSGRTSQRPRPLSVFSA